MGAGRDNGNSPANMFKRDVAGTQGGEWLWLKWGRRAIMSRGRLALCLSMSGPGPGPKGGKETKAARPKQKARRCKALGGGSHGLFGGPTRKLCVCGVVCGELAWRLEGQSAKTGGRRLGEPAHVAYVCGGSRRPQAHPTNPTTLRSRRQSPPSRCHGAMRNGAGPEGDKSRVVEAPTQGAEHTPSPDEDKPFVKPPARSS